MLFQSRDDFRENVQVIIPNRRPDLSAFGSDEHETYHIRRVPDPADAYNGNFLLQFAALLHLLQSQRYVSDLLQCNASDRWSRLPPELISKHWYLQDGIHFHGLQSIDGGYGVNLTFDGHTSKFAYVSHIGRQLYDKRFCDGMPYRGQNLTGLLRVLADNRRAARLFWMGAGDVNLYHVCARAIH